MYREKLVRLRDLYMGQFDHLRHTLQEKRRQFLLQWQHESRKRKTSQSERTGSLYNLGIVCRSGFVLSTFLVWGLGYRQLNHRYCIALFLCSGVCVNSRESRRHCVQEVQEEVGRRAAAEAQTEAEALHGKFRVLPEEGDTQATLGQDAAPPHADS